MIKCGLCEQFKSGVCPIGTPWRQMESCMFKIETPVIREVKDLDKNVRNKKMFEEYKAGAKVEDLAERYGLSKSFVHKILCRQGKPRERIWASKIDVDTKTAILLSLSEGETLASLSRDYGISEYVIRKIRDEASAEKKNISDLEKAYDKKISDLEKVHDEYVEEFSKEEFSKEESIDIIDIEPEPEKLTFLIAGDLLKPFKRCYATEYEKRLIWAVDISSLEDLSTLIDEADGSLVIDGNFMDIIPVSIKDKK